MQFYKRQRVMNAINCDTSTTLEKKVQQAENHLALGIRDSSLTEAWELILCTAPAVS